MVSESGLVLVISLTLYAGICRKVVRKMDKAWPYCFDASLEEVPGLDCEYCRPH
jgi:hypothetical protein